MYRFSQALFLFVFVLLACSLTRAQCGDPSISAVTGPNFGEIIVTFSTVEGSNGAYGIRSFNGAIEGTTLWQYNLPPGGTYTIPIYTWSGNWLETNHTYSFYVTTLCNGLEIRSGTASATTRDISVPVLSGAQEDTNKIRLSWPGVLGADQYIIYVFTPANGWNLTSIFQISGNGDPATYLYAPSFPTGAFYFKVEARRLGRIQTSNVVMIDFDADQNNGANACLSSGQPVNSSNGNMYLTHTDYNLPNMVGGMRLSRTYNSQDQSTGLLGFGWTSTLDENIYLPNQFVARLLLDDGRAVYFGRTDPTQPFLPITPDFYGQIVRNADLTFTLTLKDGSVHQFSSIGRLLWQQDRNGNRTTLNYVNNVLTSITDAFGRTLTITTNSNGTVSQISDSMGVVADYEYFPATTRLKTVSYNDGSKYKFEYVTKVISGQTKFYISTVKDALDNILETHEYDNTTGWATTSEKYGGNEKYTFNYTNANLSVNPYTIVTDALGRVTKYYFNKSQGHNVISKIEGVCGCGGGSGSEVTTFEYDSKLNLIKKTDALLNQTTYTYDASGNRLTQTDFLGTQKFTYNTFGEVLTYKDRVDSQNPDPNVYTQVNTFDANGNLKTITDALGKVTTIEYPATSNKGLPDSVKDARQNVTKFKWFPTSGLLDEIEDPYTKKTNFTYDARGRIKTVTNALGHVSQYNYFDDTQRKVEMIYPNLDKITYKYDIRRLLESVTDERGKITAYEFDSAYRLTKITDPLLHVKEIGYDLMSNRTTYKDPLGNITDYVYDDFNRLKEIDYPAATAGATRMKQRFEYDQLGRIKKQYDTADRLTEYAYDLVNRTNTVTNAELEATTTKYNQRLQTIEVKDALNQVYQFSYDPLGRLLSQTRAGGSMSFEYDDVGNRKKRVDYQGRETKYTYDNLNRLKEIEYLPTAEYPAGPIPNQKSTYVYDEISRLKSATNDVGTVAFTYDNRNRIKTTTDVFGHLIENEYELTSTVNQKRLKFDGAMYATYNFDDADRLSNIVNSSDSSTISFGYDNEDKLTSRNYPNGVATTYEYDKIDRLTRLKDVGTAATFFDRQYSYNAANQIQTITEPANTRNFGYDLVDRLRTVTASNNQNENYLFDDVGNRTSSHRSSSYGLQPFNKLVSTATADYGYDANGNMTSKGDGSNFWRYTWDYENRMGSAATRKQTVRYRYDALGRRVQRAIAGGKENTKFIYDGQDVLVDDNSGTLTKYLNGGGIDNKLRQTTGSTASYFLSDHLGSTNGLADATGALTASTAYDSFGNSTNNLTTRYQFTGREYDSFTGLQFSRARWYDPAIGRFISEDPIGLAGGINHFAYVGNNPLNLIDPFGLQDGPVNYLRNPFSSDHWILNGSSNTVSDLLGLDSVARWGWTIGDYRCSNEERIGAGAKLVGWTAAQAFGGYVIGRGLGFVGKRLTPYLGRLGRAASGRAKIPWDTWGNYPKVSLDGETFASVGGRNYTEHAVERMQPSGMRYSAGYGDGGFPQIHTGNSYGRGVAPQYVEDAIASSPGVIQPNGNISHTSGSLQVILSSGGNVVTIITH